MTEDEQKRAFFKALLSTIKGGVKIDKNDPFSLKKNTDDKAK